MNTLIDRLANVAAVASQKIVSLAHLRSDVATKSDQTPVTQVDMVVSQYLESTLPQVLDAPVVSEESSLVTHSERRQWHAYWLVDPLDGTKDFIAGKRGVAVNIALMIDHRPAMGVIAGPYVDSLYLGWLPSFANFVSSQRERIKDGDTIDDKGAFKKPIKAEGDWTPIASSPPCGGLRLYRSRSHGSDQDWSLLEGVEVASTLSLGSALKMCRIAEGAADIYVRSGPTGEWDTAAAEAILLAAGGSISNWDGVPLTYNKESPLNPPFIAMARGLSVKSQRLVIET